MLRRPGGSFVLPPAPASTPAPAAPPPRARRPAPSFRVPARVAALAPDAQTTLFVQWYRSSNPDRQREIDYCLGRNVRDGGFGRVVVFVPGEDEAALRELEVSSSCEIVTLPSGGRLRYTDALRRATDESQIYVVVNSDIVVPSAARARIVGRLSQAGPPLSICLTRWESDLGETVVPRIKVKARSSQDLWAFRGGPVIRALSTKAFFPLGVPACDHRIASLLSKVSVPINPCLSVVTLHVHRSAHRTYRRKDRLPGPYRFVEACH